MRALDGSSLTSIRRDQLDAIVDALRSGHRSRGRPWALSLRQRVVITTTSLRTNLTLRELADVFAISRSQVHRIISDITVRLARLLPGRCLLIVDGRGSSMELSCRRETMRQERSPRTTGGPVMRRS